MKMAVASAARLATHNLGPAARIPEGEGRTFVVDDHEIAVFRDRRRALFATQAWCPHRGGPLADGMVGGGKVLCPLHAFRFDLASGAADQPGCGHLRTYPVALSDSGDILVTIGEDGAT